MIHIEKGSAPTSLRKMQAKPGARFGNVDFPRDDVCEGLLKEQGYLCAYCMSKITKETMKIEHWIPQNGIRFYPEYTQDELDKLGISYHNMLGVCKGVIATGGRKVTTCDTHREARCLDINPLSEASVAHLKYDVAGNIVSDNARTGTDIEILNLNAVALVANRLAALNACKNLLIRRRPQGAWSAAMLDKQIRHFESLNIESARIPYCGVVLFFLKKRRAGAI